MSSKANLSVLALDIDGVLTDGKATYGPDGAETKSLSYHDIDAVFEAHRRGLHVALVTAEETPWVDFLSQRLQVEHVIRNAKDKLQAIQELAATLAVSLHEICYLGDSDRDAPALAAVGLGMAPASATPRAKQAAHVVLRSAGGNGAVWEALELLLTPKETRFFEKTGLLEQEQARVRAAIAESIAVQQAVLERLAPDIARAAGMIGDALRQGHKVLAFGNGGSAADAQHLAAELVGRYEHERGPLPAVALTTNTSILTAVGNDYGQESIFARQVEALGQRGDVAIAISTSGNSPNVLSGVQAARAVGMQVIGLTGQSGGHLRHVVDLCLCVPSQRTARIQEAHALIIHVLCELLDTAAPPDEDVHT